VEAARLGTSGEKNFTRKKKIALRKKRRISVNTEELKSGRKSESTSVHSCEKGATQSKHTEDRKIEEKRGKTFSFEAWGKIMQEIHWRAW